jgi:hypothetical protein
MDLFDHSLKQRMKHEAPLAARMRPRTLDEFVGQEDIVGPGKLLRRAIEADRLFSSIILNFASASACNSSVYVYPCSSKISAACCQSLE